MSFQFNSILLQRLTSLGSDACYKAVILLSFPSPIKLLNTHYNWRWIHQTRSWLTHMCTWRHKIGSVTQLSLTSCLWMDGNRNDYQNAYNIDTHVLLVSPTNVEWNLAMYVMCFIKYI